MSRLCAPESFSAFYNGMASQQQIENALRNPDTLETQLYAGSITQLAGVYLHLPQNVICQAIVYLQRYIVNFPRVDTESVDILHCAALLLSCQVNELSLDTSLVARVGQFIADRPQLVYSNNLDLKGKTVPYPPGVTHDDINAIRRAFTDLLKGIGFDTVVHLPHTLALSYAQLLGLDRDVRYVLQLWALLNDAIRMSPLLLLVHQPHTVAVAGMAMVAGDLDIAISDEDWWEIFDVNLADLKHCTDMIDHGLRAYKDRKET